MSRQPPWTDADIPDQAGKTFLITGANSGLGYLSALILAGKNADVVIASRNRSKARRACELILEEFPQAQVETMQLDLASLGSIHEFAAAFHRRHARLDVLLNNAGVMATPYQLTDDGFEMQFGTNHLGHFALTGLLLDLLLSTPASRVVTVSSMGEMFGRMRFSDLQRRKSYERWTTYAQSKLANLLFAFELQRRFSAHNTGTISLAAHPGFAESNLRKAQLPGNKSAFQRMLLIAFEWMSQDGFIGVLPQLYAATAPQASGGGYYGPDGFFHIHGYPEAVRSSRKARDAELARRLWQVSVELTGVSYTWPTARPR